MNVLRTSTLATPVVNRDVIDIHSLYFSYSVGPPTQVLRDVNLTVKHGEYVSLMGPSGAGKSTLLNVLGLLDQPSHGSYALKGQETTALRNGQRAAFRSRNIGFVFQAFHLMPYRSAKENVELSMVYAGVAKTERRRRAAEVLERVGLSHRMHSLPSEISGGEKQRVAIARAIVTQPELLLCDEPTGNLDSRTTSSIMSLLDDLNSDGHTIVMITHDVDVAARAARHLLITDGEVNER